MRFLLHSVSGLRWTLYGWFREFNGSRQYAMTSASASDNTQFNLLLFLFNYYFLRQFTMRTSERNNTTFIFLSECYEPNKDMAVVTVAIRKIQVVKNVFASEYSVSARISTRLKCNLRWEKNSENTVSEKISINSDLCNGANVEYHRWRVQWNCFVCDRIATEISSKIRESNVCYRSAACPHWLSATPNRWPTRCNWRTCLANTRLTRFGASVHGENLCTHIRWMLELQHYSERQGRFSTIRPSEIESTKPRSRKGWVPLPL